MNKRNHIHLCMLLLWPMLTLFSEAAYSQGIQTHVLKKTTQSWDGSNLPDYPKDQPEITIVKVKIDPGATVPWHRHPVINAGYILSGEIRVTTEDNEVVHLKTGDTVVELVDKWHRGTNEGTEPVEIIVFYAGEVGKSLSIPKEK